MFVDDSAVTADLHDITVVTLLRHHKLDPSVPVPVVVPVHERRNPQAGLFHTGEWAPGVIRPIFLRAEHRLGIGVVVANSWSGEGPHYSQLFQPASQRGCSHGVAVIRMENQWLLAALADPLSQARSAH